MLDELNRLKEFALRRHRLPLFALSPIVSLDCSSSAAALASYAGPPAEAGTAPGVAPGQPQEGAGAADPAAGAAAPDWENAGQAEEEQLPEWEMGESVFPISSSRSVVCSEPSVTGTSWLQRIGARSGRQTEERSRSLPNSYWRVSQAHKDTSVQ